MSLRFIFVPPPGTPSGRGRTDEGEALEITTDTLVADIAAHHPRSIDVFDCCHGIDFCFGGRRPVGEAGHEHGAPVEAVAAEIAAAAARELPEHLHLESNVLFSRVVSLDAHAAARRVPMAPAC